MVRRKVIMSARDALEKLKRQNQNFVSMDLKNPNLTKKRLVSLRAGQYPFAAILSCSDSRVPVELIFDTGLGDIFVVRNAGNILNDHVIGSLEYAVVYLGVRLIVILGHEECGAIKAAICTKGKSKYITTLVKAIQPALELAQTQEGDVLVNTTKNNVILSTRELLKKNCILTEYTKKQGLMVVPAHYCLKSGNVEFYEDELVNV